MTKSERLKERQSELARLYREVSFHQTTRYSRSGPRSYAFAAPANFEWLARVEDFVLLVAGNEQPAYIRIPMPRGAPAVRETPIGQALRKLEAMADKAVKGELLLSPRAELFRAAYEQPLRGSLDLVQEESLRKAGVTYGDVDRANRIVGRIRRELESPSRRRLIRSREQIAASRYEKACSYVDSLFQRTDELLVVSLILSAGAFWINLAPPRPGVRLPIVEGVVNLLAKGRHRAALRHMVGYTGCWEYSGSKKLHARVIFFLAADRVADPAGAAKAIGELWMELTDKKGAYSSSYLCASESPSTFTYFKKSEKRLRDRFKATTLLYLAKREFVFQDSRIQLKDRFFRGEIIKSTSNRSVRSALRKGEDKSLGATPEVVSSIKPDVSILNPEQGEGVLLATQSPVPDTVYSSSPQLPVEPAVTAVVAAQPTEAECPSEESSGEDAVTVPAESQLSIQGQTTKIGGGHVIPSVTKSRNYTKPNKERLLEVPRPRRRIIAEVKLHSERNKSQGDQKSNSGDGNEKMDADE